MFLIDNILVHQDILKEKFVCDLSKCKGACCWEGDFGAPLEDGEVIQIENNLASILPYLTEESKLEIGENGFFKYYKELKSVGTRVLKNAHCVFLNISEGVGQCAIEQACQNGDSEIKKPISCHLYPIRIDKNVENGFVQMRYDRWDICKAACSLGEKLKVKVYVFLKEAIIRKYGEEFYSYLSALDAEIDKEI
jgi:hypothetical protein